MRELTLKARLTAVVGVATALLALGLGVYSGHESSRLERAATAQGLEELCRMVANTLQTADMDSVLNGNVEESSAYSRALDVLRHGGGSSQKGATFYTTAKTDSGWIFLVDAYEGDDHSQALSIYEVNDKETQKLLDNALSHGGSFSPELVKDEWGVWMSAFGKMQGTAKPVLVGADISAAFIQEREQKAFYKAIGVSVGGGLVVAFFVYWMMGLFLRKDLGKAMRTVASLEQGDLRGTEGASTSDELGQMATKLHHLAECLRDVVGADQVQWESVKANLVAARRLASLIENMDQKVIELDSNGHIRHCNKSASVFLEEHGKAVAKLEGHSLSEIHPAFAGANPEDPVPTAWMGKRCWKLEVQQVVDAKGEALGLIATLHDVTDGMFLEKSKVELQEAVRDIMRVVAVATEGNLTQRIGCSGNTETDRLGQGIDCLVENLAENMRDLAKQSSRLAEGAGKMSTSSGLMKTSALNTQEAAQDCATVVATVRKGMEMAKELANRLKVEIAHVSDSSLDVKKRALDAVQITKGAQGMVDELNTASKAVTDVTRMVADIARQTNMLALNAAVEAERAGDVGRGFAVVASEVKNLAQRTRSATEDIDNRLETMTGITKRVERVIQDLEISIAKIANLQQDVAQAIQVQTDATCHIAENVEGSFQSVQKVEDRLHSMEKAAGQSTETANAVCFHAKEIDLLSTHLATMVEKFHVGDGNPPAKDDIPGHAPGPTIRVMP